MPPSLRQSQSSPATVKQVSRNEKKEGNASQHNTHVTNTTAAGLNTTDANSPYNVYGGGMYGSNLYGHGAYGMYGGGLYGMSPYYGGMAPAGPLSGLNQFLFGVQNVVFSLGQAVQIIGMNTHALQQLLESVSTMFDHAINTYNEIRTLEATACESEEEKKRRRRLRALRWAVITFILYAGFKVIRVAFRCTKSRYLCSSSNADKNISGLSGWYADFKQLQSSTHR